MTRTGIIGYPDDELAGWEKLRDKFHPFSLDCTDDFIIFVRIIIFVMDTKLTLKLDKVVIKRAKEYASSRKRSLSRIIESYLQSLTVDENSKNDANDIEITPFVKSISSGVHLPADLDYKSDYSEYLTQKYK